MHSHIWFHHVSPCPAVSPRRWAGHHPVRHPVRGSQTASEWLIINPGSLRPPNKNLNRSPPKKNSHKNWMVTLNCHASSSPNPVGANLWTIWDPKKGPKKGPSMFLLRRALLQVLPLPQHWLFGRDHAPPEKCWGLSWPTISEILLYDQPVPSDNTGFWTLLASFCIILLVLFWEEKVRFRTVSPCLDHIQIVFWK